MQWDPRKGRENERKHGIRFSDIEPVFFDPSATTVEDTAARGEQRFITIGRDGFDRVLVVVYTIRDGDVRLISARKASRSELKVYEEGV
ncbi:MAG: BrnT family toxin [Gammaproteobacteria bacterium]|nr:BrnT family toxin [Gammaproteobacteria bacterium]